MLRCVLMWSLCDLYILGPVPLCLRSKVKNKKLYLATFASVLGPMSFGFVLGYSSPAIPELTKIADPRLRLDQVQASWFGVRHRLWFSHELSSVKMFLLMIFALFGQKSSAGSGGTSSVFHL